MDRTKSSLHFFSNNLLHVDVRHIQKQTCHYFCFIATLFPICKTQYRILVPYVSHYNVGHDWPIGISLERPIYFEWNWNCLFDLNRLVPIEVNYMEKNPGMFSSKTWRKNDMDVLDDMGVSKLSAKVIKVN